MTRRYFSKLFLVVLALLFGILVCSGCAGPKEESEGAKKGAGTATTDVASIFAGKRVTLVANMKEGGSTDLSARLIAKYLGQYIPGNPLVIVENQPGADGLVGLRYVFEQAKPDGLTIGVLGGNPAANQALGVFPPHIDVRKMPIIAAVSDPPVAVGRTEAFPEGYRSFKQLRKKIYLAQLSKDDAYAQDEAWLRLLGLKAGKDYEEITGYSTGSEAHLAMERGEVDYYSFPTVGFGSKVGPRVEAGQWVPLWQAGIVSGTGEVTRHPSAKDVPLFDEVYRELRGGEPSGPEWEYCQWRRAACTTYRLIALPPGTPEQICAALRDAWQAMIKDPKYVEENLRISGGEATIPGTDAEKLVEEVVRKGPDMKGIVEELWK